MYELNFLACNIVNGGGECECRVGGFGSWQSATVNVVSKSECERLCCNDALVPGRRDVDSAYKWLGVAVECSQQLLPLRPNQGSNDCCVLL